MVGTIRLRIAQGMKLRSVKSGTLYGRAMHLARNAGAKLKRVYVVPPGRGDLTNAFGSSESIAMTDNFGEYLHGPQLDFVIGHELAHAKNKHTRKKFMGRHRFSRCWECFRLCSRRWCRDSQPLKRNGGLRHGRESMDIVFSISANLEPCEPPLHLGPFRRHD